MSAPNYDQIAFDMAFTHLAQQGVPSYDEDEDCCRYRMEGGRMCGIGPLIPDGEYSSDMEGHGVGEIKSEAIVRAIRLKVGGDPNLGLLREIQRIHDQDHFRDWKSSAAALAKTHNLSTATIDALDWSACEATA